MRTTVLNPENPRRRRRARRRYVRRPNGAENPRRRRRRRMNAAENPRRRRYRRRYYRNAAENPRRRRRGYIARRRNPENPEINFSRIGYAVAGGVGVRLAMRKVAGKRETEGAERKLSTMHYVAALGTVYFAPDIAEAIGATPEEARAFADGAAAVAGNMMVDQHLRDFSAANLMPFDSPAPTGTDMAGLAGRGGMAGGLGSTRANPLPYNQYMRLAGLGQLPPGGVYVRGADGSVWWFPSGARAGMRGAMGAAPRMRELPDNIRVGAMVRDTDSGERFVVGLDRGNKVLIPAGAVRPGMGAGYGEYLALVNRRA